MANFPLKAMLIVMNDMVRNFFDAKENNFYVEFEPQYLLDFF